MDAPGVKGKVNWCSVSVTPGRDNYKNRAIACAIEYLNREFSVVSEDIGERL